MLRTLRELTRGVAAGAKVVAVLNSHFHQDLDPDAEHAGRENIPTNNFREVFAGHGSRVMGIRHGHKQPHADFILRFAGLKKDAGAGNADRAAHVFKVVFVGVGRADAHQLGDAAAAAATALRVGILLLVGTSNWAFLRHEVVLGDHRETIFPEKYGARHLLWLVREECNPSATIKPIVKTYP
jgi:hypothetical protein